MKKRNLFYPNLKMYLSIGNTFDNLSNNNKNKVLNVSLVSGILDDEDLGH